MKMVKSLLLGSAAGLVALTGAQAADLPVKAKPVEYVKVCSLYGAGFYYIPGTDTCIRIGGHIRAEVHVNSRGTNLQSWAVGNGFDELLRRRKDFHHGEAVFGDQAVATHQMLAPFEEDAGFLAGGQFDAQAAAFA